MALSAMSIAYLLKQPHNALGDLVWSYAEGKLEEHEEIASSGDNPPSVGRGECTDFVNAALEFAGAKPGDLSDEKNYTWGYPVFPLSANTSANFQPANRRSRHIGPEHESAQQPTVVLLTAAGGSVRECVTNASCGGRAGM
jgi:hypothetical protein